jgi:flagellar FliL protein
MPPKNDPAPAAAPAAAPAPAPAPAPTPAGPSKIAALLPVIMVVILAPVVSWAVAQFVILPSMEKRLSAAVGKAASAPAGGEVVEESHASSGESSGKGGSSKEKDKPSGPSNTYDFTNMVVNLAGTMGTRYLKVTFMVTGKDPNLRDLFNKEKPKLVDITLNVLSSLSLADLEEAGAKNIIREKLVNAYNQAFGKHVVEQIYFSDFVVQ